MVKALFDTNIVIDFLRGVRGAGAEFNRYNDRAISIMTWIEVLVGTPPEGVSPTRDFLSGSFQLVELDGPVAARAVEIRRSHRIKLPDAIVWASAQVEQRLLVTRNTKDFPVDHPGVRVPYRI